MKAVPFLGGGFGHFYHYAGEIVRHQPLYYSRALDAGRQTGGMFVAGDEYTIAGYGDGHGLAGS